MRMLLGTSMLFASVCVGTLVFAQGNTTFPQNEVSNPSVCSGARECVKSLAVSLGRDVPLQAASWYTLLLFTDNSLSTHGNEGIYAKGLADSAPVVSLAIQRTPRLTSTCCVQGPSIIRPKL